MHAEVWFQLLKTPPSGCFWKLFVNLDVNINGFIIHSYLLDGDKWNVLRSLPDLEKKLPSDVTMTLICIVCYVSRNDDEVHDRCFYYEIYENYLKDMNCEGLVKSLSKIFWN